MPVVPDDGFHHARLPESSDLLVGREPPSALGWVSSKLQIWFNRTEVAWRDAGLHVHDESDEVFVVLRGALVVEAEGARRVVGAGEYCCFRQGVAHAVVEVHPPVETLMIRAPSVADKRSVVAG